MATAPGYLDSAITTATYNYTDFNLTVSPTSISGTSGTITLTATPSNLNGFPFPVTFSCSSSEIKCSFSPASLTPGNSAASTTVTVSAASGFSEFHRNSSPLFPGSVLAVTLCCFGWRKRRGLRMLLLIIVSVAGMSLINGCGISPCLPCNGEAKTASVTHSSTVIAASGSVLHTTSFSYTVNEQTIN
jgi:hypothetical protein